MPRNPVSKVSSFDYPETQTTTFPTPSSVFPHPAIPTTFIDNLPLPSLFVFDLDYTLWPFWVDTHVTPPLKPATARIAGEGGKLKKKKSRGYLHKLHNGDGDVHTEAGKEDSGGKEAGVNTKMVDCYGEHFEFYPGVPAILAAARERAVKMSVASRTHAPDLAREMLRGLYVVPPSPHPSQGLMVEEKEQQGKSGAEKEKEKGKQKERSRDSRPLKAIDHFIHPQMYPGSKVGHFKKIQTATVKDTINFPGGRGVRFEDMVFFDDEARNRDVEAQLGVVFVLVRDGVTAGEVDKGVREWRRRRGIGDGGGVRGGV